MPNHTVGAFEAKTRLSALLAQVSRGRTFVITRRGRPIAELRPIADHGPRLAFGCDKGQVVMGDDFDSPLPEMGKYER